VLAALAPFASGVVTSSSPEPFAFLGPGVRIGAADRRRLDAGHTVVKMLPASGRELGVVAAVRITAPPERLLAWTRDIAALRRSRYVPLVSRFSSPPRIEDLEARARDERERRHHPRRRPRGGGLKFIAGEMARLQLHITEHADWRPGVQQEFRRIVLDRVEAYLRDGDGGLPPYNDERVPIAPVIEFAALVDRLGLLQPPGVSEYLQYFPRLDRPDVVDSFLYWSTEALGAKPITSVTHVTLLQGEEPAAPRALVVSKQLFATHYRNGAVSMTAITGWNDGRYLVYVHRSHLDVLEGFFAGLLRHVIEGRVQDEAPDVLDALRTRLESGDPP
jgi:hypothetical protein